MERSRIAMSQRERDVLKVLAGVLSGERTQVEAARLLRKSVRQVRRLVRRLERDGDAGIVHRLRGQPSNRRLDGSVREKVLTAYRRDYSDFGPTLASEKLALRGFHVSSDTLRRWLLEAGLWERKRQRAQHRRRRPRRECFGELVQMDTSIHEWLEGRGEAMVLVSMTDDATGRVLARFYEGETVEAHLDLLGRWLERYGRPVALYTDHDSIFESHAKGRRVEGSTQFSRALGELGIELILAGSPQAKGRVERLFGTLQDRWVKEMRLEQIATRAAANELLEHRLLDDHNRRFAKKPTSPNDAHRPLLAEHRLPAILSVQHQRTVTNDYCVRFANDIYQLAKPALPGLRGGKVTIELRLDGTMAIRFRDRYLAYHGLGALPPDPRSLALSQHPAERETGEADGSAPPSAVTLTAGRSGRTPAEPYPPDGTPQPKKTTPYRPPVNHPWRRKFLTK